MQPLQLGHHLRRSRRTVQPEAVNAHALQYHQRCRHIGAGYAPPVFVTGERDENGLSAHTADRQHRRPCVGQRHHRLNDEQIHPGVLQGGGLLRVNVLQLLKIRVAQGRQKRAGGGQVAGAKGAPLRRLRRQRGETAVELRRAVENTVGLQPPPVRAEGGGVQHLASRLHVAPLDLQNILRVLQRPLLEADLSGAAALLQFGAGGTVQQQGKMKLHHATSTYDLNITLSHKYAKKVPVFHLAGAPNTASPLFRSEAISSTT